MAILKLKVDSNSLSEAIDKQLDEVADFIFQKSQENIVNKSIIDEGTLLKSGNINRKPFNKEIIYPVIYADSIEFGRIPGSMPPIEPIMNWIRRKLGISDEKEVRRIAFAISTDIKTNGLFPRPFLGPAIESAKAQFK